MNALVPDTLRDWLILLRAPGLGERTLNRLLRDFDSPGAIVTAGRGTLERYGLGQGIVDALHRPDEDRLHLDMAWLAADHHHLITLDDALYPPLLLRTPEPPPALFVNGRPEVLLKPSLAIVGARAATAGGLDNAAYFAATLARAGLVITSGLAAGIDSAAHAACLDAGGETVAVMGTGPDRVYPARHRDLAHRIARDGALVSCFPPGTEPRPGHFPVRNRIISGLSLGTLVIEAGIKSGSLITARLAAEQGREVFALPGSIHNPVARGCHRLIRDGATLVERAAEVIEALRPLAGELAAALSERLADAEGVEPAASAPHISHDPAHRCVLDAVGFDPTPEERIIQRSELTTAAVSSILQMLELDGRVIAHPGGRYSRTRSRSK